MNLKSIPSKLDKLEPATNKSEDLKADLKFIICRELQPSNENYVRLQTS